jgi:hypothetical protein
MTSGKRCGFDAEAALMRRMAAKVVAFQGMLFTGSVNTHSDERVRGEWVRVERVERVKREDYLLMRAINEHLKRYNPRFLTRYTEESSAICLRFVPGGSFWPGRVPLGARGHVMPRCPSRCPFSEAPLLPSPHYKHPFARALLEHASAIGHDHRP